MRTIVWFRGKDLRIADHAPLRDAVDTGEVIPRLARRWKADRVVAYRWVEPFARERDRRVREVLGIDAAARQLLGEGFVHNRARMISASVLTKHRLIDYRRGQAHYMKDLTDGDRAQNNAGWQWSAGCGCDAQPYFRIFNPVTQDEKFDPEGDDVRRGVRELGRMPARDIHHPWEAPDTVLRGGASG
jgi:deoxyribodipyrimidine photolyase